MEQTSTTSTVAKTEYNNPGDTVTIPQVTVSQQLRLLSLISGEGDKQKGNSAVV